MIFGLKWFGIGILLTIAESVLMPAIDLAGIRPDLLMLALVLISGETSFSRTLLVAFLLGVTRDMFSLSAPGMSAFALTLTAFLLLKAEEYVLAETWTGQCAIAFAGTLIYGIMIILLKPLLHYELGSPVALVATVLGSSLYTAALAPCVYIVVRRPQALPYLRLKLKHITEHETIPEIKT
ncbi:MAG: rod shape-determining protein MreD [Candidatus Abyssobacteria bacterium SURF_5]|uniref:Rod shape-determining protein MreD n=1 Tax=Abyssobacteria bacterium (strain SURF_5) TaxID=2093360 RepID=A0A3A4NLU3_ABYX5|nr:MAG: rod shape-determining protein MreD [Candidatus Abyssubacteria bacterium SURF_5]